MSTISNIIGTDKNVIGDDVADNVNLYYLELQAIRFLKSIAAQYQPLFLAYSGGKDSEVVLHLAQKAQIEFTPFFNMTTIDPPGTLKYIREKGNIMIIPPKRTFFQLIEHRGLPSTFQRFCCDKLKERYVAHYVITGVRRAESKRRADRYKEPSECHVYSTGQRGQNFMPILYWTDEDVEQYITREHIQCHPIYYDADGKFNVKQRLGCMACPLRYDRGRADFMKYPVLIRAWCRALAAYRNSRIKPTKSVTYFRDEYENFYHNIFHHSLSELEAKRNQPNGFDPRAELERLFKITLDPPKSKLVDIMARWETNQSQNR